jgi:hypothetical protein
MLETKSPVKTVELCLSCHLGNEQKTVDHELLAAGHPVLIFELETFSALMPAHWKPTDKPYSSVQRWEISQAIALRESMKQLGRRAGGKAWEGWGEFSDFECSACHHNLAVPSSRQERGYAGRAGVPPWDEARYAVLRNVVGAVGADHRKNLDTSIGLLKTYAQNPLANRAAVVEVTSRIANLLNAVLPMIESQNVDGRLSNNLLRTVAGDSSYLADAGSHSAIQATMAVDVLYRATTRDRSAAQNAALNDQINKLYGLLQSESRYSADEFATELKKVQTLVGN